MFLHPGPTPESRWARVAPRAALPKTRRRKKPRLQGGAGRGEVLSWAGDSLNIYGDFNRIFMEFMII